MLIPKQTPTWVFSGLFLIGAYYLLADSPSQEPLPKTPTSLPSPRDTANPESLSSIQLVTAEETVAAQPWISQVSAKPAELSALDLATQNANHTGSTQEDRRAAESYLTPRHLPPPRLQVPKNSTQFDPAELSDQDRVLLSNLPPICTSDLPGLDLNEQNRGISIAMLQTAMQASDQNFPSENPKLSPANSLATNSLAAEFAPEQQLINSAIDLAANDPRAFSQVGHIESHTTTMPSLNPHSSAATGAMPTPGADGKDPHFELYSRSPFPSATECAQCHQQIYEEWASSSHAYAGISPMFHAFEDTINRLSQGTIGYFCLRCHAPVATTMGLRRDQPIWDGPRVFREGVTCVACHRVKTIYTKASGERRIEPGDIYAPVYGSGSGESVEVANKYAQFFKFKTNPQDSSPGQPIHSQAIEYEELKESSFCMSCHHVQVKPGIKLEVVWDQYRASPAYRDGVSCQDCHMGKVPGVDAGYSVGPAAVFEGKTVNPERRHSNHVFYGPGYSIAHPGIFPDDPKADRWTVNQWLEFDWREGWGTDAFEEPLADGKFVAHFPPTWAAADDRYDAREIVDRNLKKLEYKKDLRRQVLENGSKLDGPFFSNPPQLDKNLTFHYCLTSLNSGHNMPSGSLGAQPQIWMNVVLIDPAGNRIWESGYLDSQGDLADRHSADVLARKIPYDSQLLNLQTRFLTSNVKGTDREMYLPINLDFDQLPFIRPAPQPVSVLNHPPTIRMEAHSLPPLGSRNVKYSIPKQVIRMPGTYRLSVRMRSRAEPIYFMKFCNATPEMIRSMNEWIADFHIQSVMFEVH